MKLSLIILISLFIINGCKSYEDEYQISQERVTSLEQSIDSIKSSPAYMYGLAHHKIHNKEYDEAKTILYDLNRTHSGWNQSLVIESINYVNSLQRPEADVMPKQN